MNRETGAHEVGPGREWPSELYRVALEQFRVTVASAAHSPSETGVYP